jgi:hypothetical protein
MVLLKNIAQMALQLWMRWLTAKLALQMLIEV